MLTLTELFKIEVCDSPSTSTNHPTSKYPFIIFEMSTLSVKGLKTLWQHEVIEVQQTSEDFQILPY